MRYIYWDIALICGHICYIYARICGHICTYMPAYAGIYMSILENPLILGSGLIKKVSNWGSIPRPEDKCL